MKSLLICFLVLFLASCVPAEAANDRCPAMITCAISGNSFSCTPKLTDMKIVDNGQITKKIPYLIRDNYIAHGNLLCKYHAKFPYFESFDVVGTINTFKPRLDTGWKLEAPNFYSCKGSENYCLFTY